MLSISAFEREYVAGLGHVRLREFMCWKWILHELYESISDEEEDLTNMRRTNTEEVSV
jgi:hypothetical protein